MAGLLDAPADDADSSLGVTDGSDVMGQYSTEAAPADQGSAPAPAPADASAPAPDAAPAPDTGGSFLQRLGSGISDVGLALGGGVEKGVLTPDEEALAGRRALMNFGVTMLQAAGGGQMAPRGNLGAMLGEGLSAAEASNVGAEQTAIGRAAAAQELGLKRGELGVRQTEAAGRLALLKLQLAKLTGSQAAGQAAIGGGGSGQAGAGAGVPGDFGKDIPRDTSVETAGQQANNPGNLMADTALPAGAVGRIPVAGGRYVAAFPDLATGIAANADNLAGYQTQHGINTVAGAVKQWVNQPGADLTSYTADVAKALGVGPEDKIDLTDPTVQQKFILAQQPHETGGKAQWLTPDAVAQGVALAQQRRQGGPVQVAGAGGGTGTGDGTAPVNQPPTTPANDPDIAASNAEMQRNLAALKAHYAPQIAAANQSGGDPAAITAEYNKAVQEAIAANQTHIQAIASAKVAAATELAKQHDQQQATAAEAEKTRVAKLGENVQAAKIANNQERLKTYNAAGDSAQNLKNGIDTIELVLPSVGPSDTVAQMDSRVRDTLQSLGIGTAADYQKWTAQDVMQQLSNRAALMAKPAGISRMSNLDVGLITGTMPRLGQSPAAREIGLAAMKTQAQIAIDEQRAASQSFSKAPDGSSIDADVAAAVEKPYGAAGTRIPSPKPLLAPDVMRRPGATPADIEQAKAVDTQNQREFLQSVPNGSLFRTYALGPDGKRITTLGFKRPDGSIVVNPLGGR
jgi:hypothetical protein